MNIEAARDDGQQAVIKIIKRHRDSFWCDRAPVREVVAECKKHGLDNVSILMVVARAFHRGKFTDAAAHDFKMMSLGDTLCDELGKAASDRAAASPAETETGRPHTA